MQDQRSQQSKSQKNGTLLVKVSLLLSLGLALFVGFDHMMRVDQQNMCNRGDQVECPGGLWIWD